MGFELISAAFTDGGEIPAQYTCDGDNTPPPMAWAGTPDGTAELLLLVDDPDARGFVHWLVVGIPADTDGLSGARLPEGAREGRNDFGRTGYGGPCPPSGSHHYQFTLYALSQPTDLAGTPNADDLQRTLADSVLAQARLTASYQRHR
jgi:Raf kinase inhibitor-like YbhB/YbcL family protein